VNSTSLRLIPEATITKYLDSNLSGVLSTVRAAYHAHYAGSSSCPHSLFLRFSEQPTDRIIALPAYVRTEGRDIAGIKWVSSFPGNLARDLPRASAVIILNDTNTGVPFAVLAGAAISAARTAAFAALAADSLLTQMRALRVGVVGCGRIAATTLTFLREVFGEHSRVAVYDLVPGRVRRFIEGLPADQQARCHETNSVRAAFDGVDVGIIATTAAAAHIDDIEVLRDCGLVLHVSLRDISESVITECYNIVDDAAHVLRERTSLHLAHLANPDAQIVAGPLGDFIWGGRKAPKGRPVVLSPFGLGVLDVALAHAVCEAAQRAGESTALTDFFVA
jgi:2,3-diaminopropionate biosynthesis protein SbnB